MYTTDTSSLKKKQSYLVVVAIRGITLVIFSPTSRDGLLRRVSVRGQHETPATLGVLEHMLASALASLDFDSDAVLIAVPIAYARFVAGDADRPIH